MEIASMFAAIMEQGRESARRDADQLEATKAHTDAINTYRDAILTLVEEVRALALAISQEPPTTDIGEQLARLTVAVQGNTDVMKDVAVILRAKK